MKAVIFVFDAKLVLEHLNSKKQPGIYLFTRICVFRRITRRRAVGPGPRACGGARVPAAARRRASAAPTAASPSPPSRPPRPCPRSTSDSSQEHSTPPRRCSPHRYFIPLLLLCSVQVSVLSYLILFSYYHRHYSLCVTLVCPVAISNSFVVSSALS